MYDILAGLLADTAPAPRSRSESTTRAAPGALTIDPVNVSSSSRCSATKNLSRKTLRTGGAARRKVRHSDSMTCHPLGKRWQKDEVRKSGTSTRKKGRRGETLTSTIGRRTFTISSRTAEFLVLLKYGTSITVSSDLPNFKIVEVEEKARYRLIQTICHIVFFGRASGKGRTELRSRPSNLLALVEATRREQRQTGSLQSALDLL